jgi:polyhydroxybutyrate depolymerase
MLGLAGPAAAALPSPGCGQAAPVQTTATFAVEGVQRQAIVVVPTAYRSDRPLPLVFAFHGRTNDNARLRRYLELENAATTPTIFVYPAAVRARDGGFSWAAPDGHSPAFGLFDQMMAELERHYCIDRSRVFVVGHSLGASFANSLACARASEIAGFATVAGGIDQQHCAGRAPGILFHNPQDDLVPIAQGQRARDVLLGAAMAASRPVNEIIEGFPCQRVGSLRSLLLWCLYRHDPTAKGRHSPHQWPEGASRLIMSFFADVAPAAVK